MGRQRVNVDKMQSALGNARETASWQRDQAARRRGAHCAFCEQAPESVRSLHLAVTASAVRMSRFLLTMTAAAGERSGGPGGVHHEP
jgi:hypothetical protein